MVDYKVPIITGTSLSVGELLRWDGSNWVNYADSNYVHENDSPTFAAVTIDDLIIDNNDITSDEGLSITNNSIESTVNQDGINIISNSQTGGEYYAGDINIKCLAPVGCFGGGNVNIFAQKGTGPSSGDGQIIIKTIQDAGVYYPSQDIHIYCEEYGSDAGTLWLQEEAGEIVCGDGSSHEGVKFYCKGDDGGLVASPTVCQFIAGTARGGYGAAEDGGNTVFQATHGGTATGGGATDGGDGGDIIFSPGDKGEGWNGGADGEDGRTVFYGKVYMTNALEAGGITGNNLTLGGGSIFIKEIAAALTDKAGYGQLWVKNTDPCELWFTDDAGTDTQIV